MSPPLLRFPRQIGLKRIVCHDVSEWDSYVETMRSKASTYTSLYSFDRYNERGLPDYDFAVMDRAWWDFDSNEEHGIEQVKNDVAALISRLKGDVRLVATGRGFHVYQFFDEPVIGRQWAHKLDRYQKTMAHGLVSLDGVGYPEKLTRIPETYNPKRGKWAVTCDVEAFVTSPHTYPIPKRPVPENVPMNPFTGMAPQGELFSLTRWIRDNPEQETVADPVEIQDFSGTPLSTSVPLPNCLDRAIRVSNPPHHVRVALVQIMANNLRDFAHPQSLTAERRVEIINEICSFIEGLGWSDYNSGVTRKAVISLMGYSRIPSPAWFRRNNLCGQGMDCWYCNG